MNKPVLVLVMSRKCGACQNFKSKELPELEAELRKDDRFRFLTLEFPDMAVPTNITGKEFHPELRNGFIEFFPTFLLFPGNLWNDPKSRLKGVAKHDLKKNPRVDYSKASIFAWIDDTLKRDPLFNSGGSNNFIITDSTINNRSIPTLGTYNRFRSTGPKSSF